MVSKSSGREDRLFLIGRCDESAIAVDGASAVDVRVLACRADRREDNLMRIGAVGIQDGDRHDWRRIRSPARAVRHSVARQDDGTFPSADGHKRRDKPGAGSHDPQSRCWRHDATSRLSWLNGLRVVSCPLLTGASGEVGACMWRCNPLRAGWLCSGVAPPKMGTSPVFYGRQADPFRTA